MVIERSLQKSIEIGQTRLITKKGQRIMQKYQLHCRVKEKKKRSGNVFYRTSEYIKSKISSNQAFFF
ncbi:hypothetical protein MAQA_04311 [Listeria aquatica FSL S10-1188]|uniref:Uncharacterized protein n=1 Tax=Listeria aquatica FSL S10-1188 TaxID=1265818 RepID=W7BAM2_9LIST|nr:hypothetical protein MAQA_04311 [Listeria aquatica FSL S10-1188]